MNRLRCGADEVRTSVVRRAEKNTSLDPVELHRVLNRNRFLVACLVYTEPAPVEYLTNFRIGLKACFDHHSYPVDAPPHSWILHPTLVVFIDDFYRNDHATEVLLFHNHPKNVLNVASANLPLAPAADRSLQLYYALTLTPYHVMKTLNRGGGIRFCWAKTLAFGSQSDNPARWAKSP